MSVTRTGREVKKSTTILGQDLARALSVVTDLLRERGPETGANIGHELRHQIPGFNVLDLNFSSLTRLLLDAADDLVVVGRKGDDRIWALGASLTERDLEHALGAEAAAEADVGASAVHEVGAAVTRAEFINFRSCRDVKLELSASGLTVLVGPNGSGKTTLLHGISYLSQVTRGKLRALFSGPRDVRRLRSGGATKALELALSAGKKVELRLKAEPGDDDTRFTVSLRSGKNTETWESPGAPPTPALPLRPESRLFWPTVLFRLQADALAEPSDVEEGEPRLSFDGAGLPTLLAHLANTDPGRLKALVDDVRMLVPEVEETRQKLRRREPNRGDPRQEHDAPTYQFQLEVKMKGAGWVPADLLSEGTLFAFGIHAVLHQRQPPRILLMDDIEHGLHPNAQRALMRKLKEVAGESGPQLIVSTHSPYILDDLPTEAVRVVRSEAGGTRVRALIEHPEWQAWKSSMTAGEFWTYVGEEWLGQGE